MAVNHPFVWTMFFFGGGVLGRYPQISITEFAFVFLLLRRVEVEKADHCFLKMDGIYFPIDVYY